LSKLAFYLRASKFRY